MTRPEVDIVKEFLSALQRRDFPAAERLLSPGFNVRASGREFGRLSELSGIRYVDRFELHAGLIVRLEVFSGMAEFRPATAS